MGILSNFIAFALGTIFGVIIMCVVQASRQQKRIDSDTWGKQ